MTADEIIHLIFLHHVPSPGQSPSREAAAQSELKVAIHQVVGERDEALACNDAMRGAMRELRVMVAMPAEGEGVVLGAVARALEKTLLYSSDNARLTRERDEALATLEAMTTERDEARADCSWLRIQLRMERNL